MLHDFQLIILFLLCSFFLKCIHLSYLPLIHMIIRHVHITPYQCPWIPKNVPKKNCFICFIKPFITWKISDGISQPSLFSRKYAQYVQSIQHFIVQYLCKTSHPFSKYLFLHHEHHGALYSECSLFHFLLVWHNLIAFQFY